MKSTSLSDDFILFGDFLIQYKIKKKHIVEYLMLDRDMSMKEYELKSNRIFWALILSGELHQNIDVDESELIKTYGGGYYPIYDAAVLYHLIDKSDLSDNFIVSPDPIDFFDDHSAVSGQYVLSIPRKISIDNIYIHKNAISELSQTILRPDDIKITNNFGTIVLNDVEYHLENNEKIILQTIYDSKIPLSNNFLMSNLDKQNMSDVFRKKHPLRDLIVGFEKNAGKGTYSASEIFKNAKIEK